MKNKLLNSLTMEERKVFKKCLNGQGVENINLDEALYELALIEGEEAFLEERGLSEERQYTYNQVRRCINSFGGYEVRERIVLQEAKND